MNPYISVIITGRNDNYGENFLLRLNTFIKSLDYQVRKFPGLFEIVLVEWNPPEETEYLEDVVYVPSNLPLRIITVPEEIHDMYKVNSPMQEYAAKNVGLLRAKGEFALLTNPDILFTEYLIYGLAEKNLLNNTVYRTDRYDYKGTDIENVPVEFYVNYALRNTFVAQIMNMHYAEERPVAQDTNFSLFSLPVTVDKNQAHTNASGDFILVNRQELIRAGGLWETNYVLLPEQDENEQLRYRPFKLKYHYDSLTLIRLLKSGMGQCLVNSPYCIFHMDHSRTPIEHTFRLETLRMITDINKNNEFWGHPTEAFEEVILQEENIVSNSTIDYMIKQVVFGNGDSDKHAMSLFGIALSLKPRKILELGVREGHTTLPLLCAAKEVMGAVYSVDIDLPTFRCPEEYILHWLFYKADAIAYLEAAVQNNDKYDLIYIDDWHSYDHVKRELELIDQISDPGTVIILHDCMYSNYQPDYHVNENDRDPQWANGGPYRAVMELPSDKWEHATIPVNHGLTILRKRGQILP